MPGTNKVPSSTCTLDFPAPFLAPAALYSVAGACFAVNRGSYSGASAVQHGFPGEMWTWWVSLTFLSLAIKIFPLYAASCTAGWCLPPWSTLGINLPQKQIADSETCLPVQALTALLPGTEVCPWLGTLFVFWQIKTSVLPQWKENFCTLPWNVNLPRDED